MKPNFALRGLGDGCVVSLEEETCTLVFGREGRRLLLPFAFENNVCILFRIACVDDSLEGLGDAFEQVRAVNALPTHEVFPFQKQISGSRFDRFDMALEEISVRFLSGVRLPSFSFQRLKDSKVVVS